MAGTPPTGAAATPMAQPPSLPGLLPATGAVMPAVPPHIGGVFNSQAWTGGPRRTGCLLFPRTPNCFRPSDNNQLSKKYMSAITPLKQVYNGKTNDDLTLDLFGSEVLSHLEKLGMDSVFYFDDPITGEERNIITHHARFKVETIKTITTARRGADRYDADNINWLGDFLFSSISTEQRRAISGSMEQDVGKNGPVAWMYLVMNNISTTIQAMLTLQNKLRVMKLSSYPGEDVTKCVQDISHVCHRLSAASKLPEDISQAICLIHSECSVPTFAGQYLIMQQYTTSRFWIQGNGSTPRRQRNSSKA
ncbi:MAG: hypothetical protein ACREOZ_01130 [Gloeomargaritales cyanobacterium]